MQHACINDCVAHKLFITACLCCVSLCVCAGLVWWQRGQDYYGGVQAASDILGLLFFILLFPSMRKLPGCFEQDHVSHTDSQRASLPFGTA